MLRSDSWIASILAGLAAGMAAFSVRNMIT
jgi:hypothetical protein